jgi:hypothetical protein
VARLWAARERKGEPVRCPNRVASPAPIEATPLPQMRQPPLPQMRPQNKDESLKKDERNDDSVVAPSRPPEEEEIPEEASEDLGPPETPEPTRADLGPLVARAQDRFGGCMVRRVADVVELYGREWVEVVLWGVLTLKDWGGVLATLGHWKTEGGPTDRAVQRARREQAKASPKPVVARRPAAERPPAEVLLSEIRREGFRLEISAEGRLELIAPVMEPLPGPRPLAERLRKQFEALAETARAGFRSRLEGLEAEVIELLRSGRPDPRGSLEGVAVGGMPCPSGGSAIVAPRGG